MAVRHHAARRGHNRDAEAVHDARQVLGTLVDAQAGLADALDALNHRTTCVIFQLELELGLSGLAAHGEIFNITLVLQHLGNRHFDLGRRHRDSRFFNRLRIADASQHVRDGITHTHIVYPLPASLDDARDFAPHRIFTQLPARQAKLAEHTTRTPGQLATVALTHWARVTRQFLQRLVCSHAIFVAGLNVGDHGFELGPLGGVFLHHPRALFFTV